MNDLELIKDIVQQPFYVKFDFWIGFVVGLIGIFFSGKAFLEARSAKQAASEMAKTIKIQTITIELTEIAQRLDKLDFTLSFVEARDLLSEVSRKLRRLIAPFQGNGDVKMQCDNLKLSLDLARDELNQLRPQNGDLDEISANSIYFGMQGHFSNISNHVAEIMGLFEKRNIDQGE